MSLNHKRLFIPGLNQHTSTNSESMHYSHKYGEFKVCASMSTTTSCNIQANKGQTKGATIGKKFAQQVGRNSVQDDSKTRDYLTPWAEEMFLTQKALMHKYKIVQVAFNKFLMMKPTTVESERLSRLSEDGKLTFNSIY